MKAILIPPIIGLLQMQSMTHAVALCLEITFVVLVRNDFDWHILNNFESVCLKSHSLCGVVGKQAHFVHAKMTQHLSATAIVALVGFKSEVRIGVNRVVAFLLKLVSLYLVHESYATSFLLHIYKHSLAFSFNHLHGLVQLLTAVATLRAENIACGA